MRGSSFGQLVTPWTRLPLDAQKESATPSSWSDQIKLDHTARTNHSHTRTQRQRKREMHTCTLFPSPTSYPWICKEMYVGTRRESGRTDIDPEIKYLQYEQKQLSLLGFSCMHLLHAHTNTLRVRELEDCVCLWAWVLTNCSHTQTQTHTHTHFRRAI